MKIKAVILTVLFVSLFLTLNSHAWAEDKSCCSKWYGGAFTNEGTMRYIRIITYCPNCGKKIKVFYQGGSGKIDIQEEVRKSRSGSDDLPCDIKETPNDK